MILVYYDGGSSSRKKKGDAYVCLLWTTVAILFLYAAVLPRRIELYSNATLVVSTWIFAFKFRNVTAAYEDPPFVEDFFRRPNLKLAGVLCNSIAPGTIATEMVEGLMTTNPVLKERLVSKSPLGRIGTVAEAAWPIIFLLTDAASFITGQTLVVDGGRLAAG